MKIQKYESCSIFPTRKSLFSFSSCSCGIKYKEMLLRSKHRLVIIKNDYFCCEFWATHVINLNGSEGMVKVRNDVMSIINV